MLQRLLVKKHRDWIAFSLLFLLWATLFLIERSVAQAATPISGPVVIRPGGAQLYSAPNGEVIATLSTGTIFTATGRTSDQLWVMGTASPEASGWLQVAQLIAVGVELLPIYDEATASIPSESAPVAEDTPPPTEPATTETPTTTTILTGIVASGDDRLNVRSGPSIDYPIIAKALPGESYPVVGRTADGAWLQIDRSATNSDEPDVGWVSAAYLEVAGDLLLLPVITTDSPPAATTPTVSTQTAAPTGAAVSDISGTLVIESSPGGMLYGYSLQSGALWSLTNGFDPAISPDGQTVTFVREGGENGVYLINIDGSNERLIFSGRARLSSPKWSPDGQWILFTRSDDSYTCIEIRGTCLDLPSTPGGGGFSIPGVEPTTRYWYNLARVDRDGNNYRDIASLTSARAADWNEAGIVYQSDAGLQITADLPDAENKLVIYEYLKPFYDDPDWQPNGGRIVYMGKEASHWELFAVNPDGSGKTALTRPATTIVDEIPSNVAPAWSPDGRHIAFLSNREQNGEAGKWRVWIMDADGANQRPLPITPGFPPQMAENQGIDDLEINYTFGGEQSISWAR